MVLGTKVSMSSADRSGWSCQFGEERPLVNTYTQHVDLNWSHAARVHNLLLFLLNLLEHYADSKCDVSRHVGVPCFELLELEDRHVVGDTAWEPYVAHEGRVQWHIGACLGLEKLHECVDRPTGSPVSRYILEQLDDDVPLRFFRPLGDAASLLCPPDIQILVCYFPHAGGALRQAHRCGEKCHCWGRVSCSAGCRNEARRPSQIWRWLRCESLRRKRKQRLAGAPAALLLGIWCARCLTPSKLQMTASGMLLAGQTSDHGA